MEDKKEILDQASEETEAEAVKVSGENASDGKEIGCVLAYHGVSWCREHDTWCSNTYFIPGDHFEFHRAVANTIVDGVKKTENVFKGTVI